MKNPHLKLGDTSRFVKHLIRALRRSSMAYCFEKARPGYWSGYKQLRDTRYRCFSNYIRSAVWGFQIHEGLPKTGECDAATWAKLERFL